MSQPPLAVAVIGVGLHGENHALVYHHDERTTLRLVCDLHEERARAIAAKYGCAWTTDVGDVARDDVAAVSVATPDFAHFAPVAALIEAGKRVLVEKPLTTDVQEAQRLVEMAAGRHVHLMVNFSQRWNPRYLTVREAIVEGRLGRVLMGASRLTNTLSVPEQMLAWSARSGPHWFLFPHIVDVVRWLIDQAPREVFARGTKGVLAAHGIDTFDVIQASVRYDSAFVTYETAWILPNSGPTVEHQTRLIGSAGQAYVDSSDDGVIIGDSQRYGAVGTIALARPNLLGQVQGYCFESIRHFVGVVRDGVAPLVTAQDGLLATQTIAAMLRSIETGLPARITES
jgi:predicted dehydrogenase